MKSHLCSLLLATTSAFAVELHGDFQGPLGLQLYSLRDSLKTDVPGTLDKAKAFGFTIAELYSGMPGGDAAAQKALLAERGITPISGHFSYDALKKDVASAVETAKTLGLKYAGVAWIPHEIGSFGEADVKRAAADFHTFGEAFKAAGIQFFYHVHGYEFKPVAEGATETYFDMLARETKPELVSFEMDVFWVFQPGADPAALLKKYGDRWALMHVKDMRKGARRGVFTGKAPLTDDVAVGTGQVNWPEVLKAAKDAGVKYYFIEDESPTVLDQIPQTLGYLKRLKF
jgi:sugar phosphate isomerase/epimerase